jgi:hypothetical protein
LKNTGGQDKTAHQKIMHPENRNIKNKISYSSSANRSYKGNNKYPKGSRRFCMAAKLPDMENAMVPSTSMAKLNCSCIYYIIINE